MLVGCTLALAQQWTKAREVQSVNELTLIMFTQSRMFTLLVLLNLMLTGQAATAGAGPPFYVVCLSVHYRASGSIGRIGSQNPYIARIIASGPR